MIAVPAASSGGRAQFDPGEAHDAAVVERDAVLGCGTHRRATDGDKAAAVLGARRRDLARARAWRGLRLARHHEIAG